MCGSPCRGSRPFAEVLFDLRQAERALSLIEEAAPDQERARYLGAFRAAVAELQAFVPPMPP
jgi:hypothetical protein